MPVLVLMLSELATGARLVRKDDVIAESRLGGGKI